MESCFRKASGCGARAIYYSILTIACLDKRDHLSIPVDLKNQTLAIHRRNQEMAESLPGLNTVADITRHEADHVQHSLWCLQAVQ